MENNIAQPIFIEKLIEFIDNIIDRARIYVGDEVQEHEIFRTIIKKDVITKYVYLEETPGTITKAELLTKDDDILVIKDYDIEKTLDGLVLTFRFEVKIQEIELGWIDEMQEGGEYWQR